MFICPACTCPEHSVMGAFATRSYLRCRGCGIVWSVTKAELEELEDEENETDDTLERCEG